MSQTVLVSWLLFAAHVLIVLVAAVLISANRKPSAAIAWILAIIFIPVLGIIFFLLVGFGKLPRKRRAKQREVCDAILARTDGLDRVSHRDEWPSWLASMVTMNRNLGSLPMVGGNSAELIESYLGSIQAMADAIDAGRALRPRRVLHPGPGRGDRAGLRCPGAGLSRAESRYGCCPITSPSSCTRTGRRRSAGSPQWARSTGRCCRCSRSAATGADRTFATTGSWSWWTALWGSPARRT